MGIAYLIPLRPASKVTAAHYSGLVYWKQNPEARKATEAS